MTIKEWSGLSTGGRQVDEPVSLTIGVFDGLHIGHRRLIASVVANRFGAVPCVVTFRQNPAAVLGKGSFPGAITSFRQKRSRLDSLGIKLGVMIDFSLEFSKIPGRNFIERLLEALSIVQITVGRDFRFGRDRDTDSQTLAELVSGRGVETVIVPPESYHGYAVSSSRIRKAIVEAEFDAARDMLVEPYALDLAESRPLEAVRDGVRIPCAGIGQVIPGTGTYEVLITSENRRLPATAMVAHDSVSLRLRDAIEMDFIRGASVQFLRKEF